MPGASVFIGALFERAPENLSDYIVTIEAEDSFDFRSRLGGIRAPTLVIGGGNDPFCSASLFRETTEGIPKARLVFDKRWGHAPGHATVSRELSAFLSSG